LAETLPITNVTISSNTILIRDSYANVYYVTNNPTPGSPPNSLSGYEGTITRVSTDTYTFIQANVPDNNYTNNISASLTLKNTTSNTVIDSNVIVYKNLINPTTDKPLCFKENTKILCLVDNEETYIPIESIRRGTFVKTSLSGYKAVDMIGHSKIYNPAHKLHCKTRLYKCTNEKYPEITEELIITGCHSILVDSIASEEQREQMIEVNGDVYVTENKYRLSACIDPRAEPYEKEGIFNIWHLALEHENYYMNYGIYANGLLVETTSKRMIREFSGMELI
jgi:hypothetical protein